MADESLLNQVFFDYLALDEVERANEIERLAYPPEEAGSLEAFIQRQKIPRLFLGAYLPSRILVGYVNATLSKQDTFTAESMHHHDSDGTSVCLHGIAVSESHRHCGLGSALLKEYIRRLREDLQTGVLKASRILLICHDRLVNFYTRAGFSRKESSVVWGPESWIEMRLELDLTSIPSSIFENTPSHGTVSKPFSSFPDINSLVSAENNNMFDIVCPRAGCESLILKAGNAKLSRGPSFQLDPLDTLPAAPLQPLPPPPSEIDWWIVTPSPYVFENIAFSKSIHTISPSAQFRAKLLACAECDLGAFGWCHEGGTEFRVAVSRVAYR